MLSCLRAVTLSQVKKIQLEIIVNTRLLLKNKLEGIGWFTYETLKRITRNHPEHHFIFAFDRDFDESFIFSDNITPVILSPQARHPVLFYIWFEYSLGGLLKSLKPDVFLSPDGYLSLSAKAKQLPVIHDLNFAHYPEDVPYLVRKYYNYFFPRFARKATRIATVSEYSKQDIVSAYDIDPSKIDVVYNGASEVFKPLPEDVKEAVREKYVGGCSYFVFVGSLHPRKNIARLLAAFDLFKKDHSSMTKLLIVGEKYWWNNDLKLAYESMQHKQEVLFTGRLAPADLKNVIGAALALTYVPYFEGFGIPILEAFGSEIPVITSDVTSMPEVAGDAALLVDPFSVESIKNAMLEIAKSEDKRGLLIARGRIRRQNYSWDKTAEKLWDSIEKTING